MKKVLLILFLAVMTLPFDAYAKEEVIKINVLSDDGYAGSPYPGSWNAQRTALVGRPDNSQEDALDIYNGAWWTSQGYIALYRSFLSFDTSSIPANAEVTSAKLVVTPKNVIQEVSDPYSYISLLPSNQLAGDKATFDDFDLCGDYLTEPPALSTNHPVNAFQIGTPFSFEFNQKGVDWVKKGGITSLCLREGHDVSNVEIINNSRNWIASGIIIFSSDSIVPEARPYLEITYTLPEEENEFPLYTQIPSPFPSLGETTAWAQDTLAGGKAGPYCKTIAQCGCTITSAVMLARSYGITEGVDGTDVNPRNFNNWLLDNNGYNPGGLLDFSQAIKYFGVEENGIQKSYFKWNGKWLTRSEVLERVSNGTPTITSMIARNRNGTVIPTHFVLMTELLQGGGYGVNDPLWYNTKNLDDDRNRESYVQDYDNKITNGRDLTFSPEPQVVAGILSASLVGRGQLANASFASLSRVAAQEQVLETAPAEMFVVTPTGSRQGVNPLTGEVYEMDGGSYQTEAFLTDPLAEEYVPPSGVLKTLYASELEGGVYRVYVVGTGTGLYEFSGLVHDVEGRAHPFSVTAPTEKGRVAVYEFSVITGDMEEVSVTKEILKEVIDSEIKDKALNKFFTQWLEKICAEVEAGKLDQAQQHIETFRTLMKARKVESVALEGLLSQYEAQL